MNSFAFKSSGRYFNSVITNKYDMSVLILQGTALLYKFIRTTINNDEFRCIPNELIKMTAEFHLQSCYK